MLIIPDAMQQLQPGLSGHEVLLQILADPLVQAANMRFLSAAAHTVPASRQALYVHQGEEASTSWPAAPAETQNTDAAGGQDVLIGSQGATTCTILVARCPVTRIAYAVHHDGCSVQLPVQRLLSFLEYMQDPQVYLLGSFQEPSGESLKVVVPILDALHRQTPRQLRLQLACVWSANTAPLPGGGYLAHSLFVQCSTGLASPCMLADRGPCMPRRYAYPHCCAAVDKASDLVRIAHHSLPGHVSLPPVPLAQFSVWHLRQVQHLLRLPDAQLLQCCSTSPEHEPEYFVEDMRASFQWQLEQQKGQVEELPGVVYKWVGSHNRGGGSGNGQGDAVSASCDGSGWVVCVACAQGEAAAHATSSHCEDKHATLLV